MSLMLLGISIAIPTAAGYLLASFLLKDDDGAGFFERLFFGFGLGVGVLTYAMFLMGISGFTYGAFGITTVLVAFSGVLIYLMARGGAGLKTALACAPRRARDTRSGGHGSWGGWRGWKLYITLLVCAWLSVKAGFVIYEALVRPMFAWDTWANWSAGAKFFYYNKGLALDPSSEHWFGKGYRVFLGHPLHTTLAEVWVSLWQGSWHEAYVKSWSAFYFISLLGIFYIGLKRNLGRKPGGEQGGEQGSLYALACVFFLSGVPMLTYHAFEGYSDLTLGYYGLAACVCLWRYVGGGTKGYLSLSGIFLAFACLTKNEGLFFFLAVAAALALFILVEKKRAGDRGGVAAVLASFLVPFAIVAGPWFIFKFLSGAGFGHSGASSTMVWFSDPKFAPDAARGLHTEIFVPAVKQLFFSANFGLVTAFWLFVSVIGLKTIWRSDIKYLYAVLLAVMAMFTFVYLVFEVTAVTEVTGINRNALTYVPIMFFVSALAAARLWPSSFFDIAPR